MATHTIEMPRKMCDTWKFSQSLQAAALFILHICVWRVGGLGVTRVHELKLYAKQNSMLSMGAVFVQSFFFFYVLFVVC